MTVITPRYGAALLAMAIVIFASIALLSMYQKPQSNAYLATVSQASINASINKTESLLNEVNKSSYLIFYPNLKQAYSDLSKAKSIANEDPGLAENLLNLSYASAQSQLSSINKYRNISFVIMLLLTAVSAVALYRLMRRMPK
ncbi:hypothetical protein M1373_02685 [Candidatus Marsarchaeota archaeon]|nr:hypothetical protein [Candidatus Marsarchaeota archaeon]MCL5404658.1 hypothetical protein [Candidatus Marsarchaeota archaeon]